MNNNKNNLVKHDEAGKEKICIEKKKFYIFPFIDRFNFFGRLFAYKRVKTYRNKKYGD